MNRIDPQAVNDILNRRPSFSIEAIRAIKAFRAAKPWRGSVEERLAKFNAFCEAVSTAYGVTVQLQFRDVAAQPSNGAWMPRSKTIVLVNKLSVVTFLFCFGLARGLARRHAFAWAHECFRRFFPLSFSRCRRDGQRLVRE